jgi:hypothetical protein
VSLRQRWPSGLTEGRPPSLCHRLWLGAARLVPGPWLPRVATVSRYGSTPLAARPAFCSPACGKECTPLLTHSAGRVAGRPAHANGPATKAALCRLPPAKGTRSACTPPLSRAARCGDCRLPNMKTSINFTSNRNTYRRCCAIDHACRTRTVAAPLGATSIVGLPRHRT